VLQTAVKVRYSIKDSWDLGFENIVVVCAMRWLLGRWTHDKIEVRIINHLG